MSLSCDFLIVGGGIIGLTVARELLIQGAGDILILEKEPGLGYHASGRNSGVLHAGIYYAADSLKARFCVEGNRLMKQYCRERKLPMLECGKVIVTQDAGEIENLKDLKQRADSAGAEVRLIDVKELREIEPHAATVELALHSPGTAVIDPSAVLKSLESELLLSGKVRIKVLHRFIGRMSSNTIETNEGPVGFKTLVNCAGAYADRIAQKFGAGARYRILPFKGSYRWLKSDRSHLVRGNIYPVPDLRNPFLGVHFSRGIDGSVSVGPTAMPALGRESYRGANGINSETPAILFRDLLLLFQNSGFRANARQEIRKLWGSEIYKDGKKLIPELQPADLIEYDKVGIRAQLVDWPARRLVTDYVIEHAENSLHILNTVSPGFTSSMAFAKHIVSELLQKREI